MVILGDFMTQKTWNRLSLFEQLSNVDGDVKRLVETHENYLNGNSQDDFSQRYLENIIRLLRMTMLDPKNSVKGYRYVELFDEVEEIRRYLSGEVSSDYILNYWNEYTNAIS